MIRTAICLSLVSIICCLPAFAQKEYQPQASARVNLHPVSDDQFYLVEIYMPESLDADLYRQFMAELQCHDSSGGEVDCTSLAVSACVYQKPNPAPGLPSIGVLFDGTTLRQYKPRLSLNDCLLSPERRGRIFSIALPRSYKFERAVQVFFYPYPTANGERLYSHPTAVTDFGVAFEYDQYDQIFRQKLVAVANPIVCVDDNPGCLADLDRLLPAFKDYILRRTQALNRWLRTLRPEQVELKIEDLTRCINVEKRGCVSFDQWRKFVDQQTWPVLPEPASAADFQIIHDYLKSAGLTPPSPGDPAALVNYYIKFRHDARAAFLKELNLTEADLPKYEISAFQIYPSEQVALREDRRMLIDIETKRTLPIKFSASLKYLDSAAPPIEFAKPFLVTSQEISPVAINLAEDTKTPGVRERPNRLDLGIQFGTSVQMAEATVDGAVIKNLDRVTRGTLDLRVSPFRQIEDGIWFAWEPIFLDAKVSTGKIEKDTLSLNRVVIGTSYDFTKFLDFKGNPATNPNYLNLSIKPVQASDRDFKQLEYKVISEFQPRLSFLNRIPANHRSTINRVLIKPGETETTRFVEPRFGFKVTPFIGGEIGKTWLRRNPAVAIEPTDYIKRIYTGLSMTFYFPLNISVNVSEKFYWNFGRTRAGLPVDPKENHFKASLDFGIRKNHGFGDSIFFSFEKGNEPPFGARDINSFKIGYRFVNPRGIGLW
jgi:hypothetical protein